MELPGCCFSLMDGTDSSKRSEAMSFRSAASAALVALSLAIILTGCGGGGGGGDTPPTGNRAPVVSLATDQPSLWPTANAQLTATASDPDNDPLTYTWAATGGTLSGTGNTRTWNAPLQEGNYTVTVTVSDGNEEADDSLTLEVLDIGPPPPPPFQD